MDRLSYARLTLENGYWRIVIIFLCVTYFNLLFAFSSYAVLPIPTDCQSDVHGANDEPGQKDLTQFCAESGDNSPYELHTLWNWDIISLSGNNTGDGCTLYDTDSDGNANLAVCVTIEGSPATLSETRLYNCNDTKPDRCAGDVQVNICTGGSTCLMNSDCPGTETCALQFDTKCEVSQKNTDPFPAGDSYTQDTEALCWVDLDDFGIVGASAFLLDACSYASSQVNSDPSDCVILQECTDSSDCDDTNDCTIDVCNTTSGFCTHTADTGASCGGTPGVCENPDTCNNLGFCQDNGFKSGDVCRESAGVCDVEETCPGNSPDCPADGFLSSDTVCRESGGVCDLGENCTGSSALCPDDAKSTDLCRGAAGVCDIDEFCDGINNDCPQDLKSTDVCRASGGVCDIAESCDGINNSCPNDGKSTAECRAAAGICDAPESCDGVNNVCPTDGFNTGNECRASAGVCDVAENCDGTGANCPADGFNTGNECRASAGVCDVAENCDGSGASCPADGFNTGNECRASAGVCDVAENCDGTGANCPADGFNTGNECRASAGECDVAENCDGGVCPPDGLAAGGTECRASAGICDIAEQCTGTEAPCPADAFEPATTVCLASADPCNPDENCPGDGAICPPDVTVDPTVLGCVVETCRTAGFWGTHGGWEKRQSINITQEVINTGGGCIDICGEVIKTTNVNNADSAIEGLCVSVSGQIQRQLARQLIAAALNCIMTTGDGSCAGTSIETLFTECNSLCFTSNDKAVITSCIDQLDCYNNGGVYDNNYCQTGTCSDNDMPCNQNDLSRCGNPATASCAGTYGCDDEPLYNEDLGYDYEPPGPAGSSNACKKTNGNTCAVIQPGETSCNSGTKNNAYETCFPP